MENGQKRLVGYVRVSTGDQVLLGVSLEAQEVRLQAYATAHGFALVGIERDEGISGKVAPSKRPGLARALQAIESGQADGIIFYKLDRLSRKVRDLLKLAEDAKRKGWILCSVSEHIDTSNAIGNFTLGIMALLAQMEREQISERTIMGMAQVARQGRARSSRIPFGYRVEGKPDAIMLAPGDRGKLVEHAAEQAILKVILQLEKQGFGAHKITTTLNGQGILNPRTQGRWSVGTMIAVMRTARKRRNQGAAATGAAEAGTHRKVM